MTPQALAAHLTRNADANGVDVPCVRAVAAELRKPTGQDWAARRAECKAAFDATDLEMRRALRVNCAWATANKALVKGGERVWRVESLPADLRQKRERLGGTKQLILAALAACDVADPPTPPIGQDPPDHLQKCLDHLASRAYGTAVGSTARHAAEKAELEKDKQAKGPEKI